MVGAFFLVFVFRLAPAGDVIPVRIAQLEIDPVHGHMAVFRAIENGMSLVRQVEGGESIAVDPYGRVLAQTNFFGSTDRTLVAQVPVKHVPTLYTSIGNWFEWLLLAGFLFTIVWALVAGRKEN